jgi:hypothetical protein
MNRRGILAWEVFVTIVRLIMVLIVIMGVGFLIRAKVNVQVDLDVLEPSLLQYIIGTSKYLQSEEYGVFSGAIDVERFRNSGKSLENSLFFSQSRAGARLWLLDEANNFVATTDYNAELYEKLSAQVQAGLGSVVVHERQWPVLFFDAGQGKNGILKVEVLMPR